MTPDNLLFAILMGTICGVTAGIFFLNWVEKRMARIQSTEGRNYQDAGKFDNTARHRQEEIVKGGAMGYPMQRLGDETLRMMPADADVAVLRQQGSSLISKVVLANREAADAVYALMQRQIETSGCLPEIDKSAPRKALEVSMKFEEGDRRLAIFHSSEGTKVVEFHGKTTRCVARMANEADARDLFAVLLGQSATAPEESEHRDYTTAAITPTRIEPCVGGSVSADTPTTTGADFTSEEESIEDPLWQQLFH